jgi:AraC-like DNA-binding protein
MEFRLQAARASIFADHVFDLLSLKPFSVSFTAPRRCLSRTNSLRVAILSAYIHLLIRDYPNWLSPSETIGRRKTTRSFNGNRMKKSITFSRLDRIDDLAHRAAASHYNPKLLAESCSISRSQLRRYILKIYGQTPQRWLDDLRLTEATNLLHTSSLSVKEIAAKLFYDYPGNFARQFRQRYGCNPSEYASQSGRSPNPNDLPLDAPVGI